MDSSILPPEMQSRPAQEAGRGQAQHGRKAAAATTTGAGEVKLVSLVVFLSTRN